MVVVWAQWRREAARQTLRLADKKNRAQNDLSGSPMARHAQVGGQSDDQILVRGQGEVDVTGVHVTGVARNLHYLDGFAKTHADIQGAEQEKEQEIDDEGELENGVAELSRSG